MPRRAAWLSVTPELERELPLAVATLRSRGPAGSAAVESERVRIEGLLLRGGQRRWIAYLHQVIGLIDDCQGVSEPHVDDQRARAVAVLENHHNLLLGLPGRGARRTTHDRAHLAALHRNHESRRRSA